MQIRLHRIAALGASIVFPVLASAQLSGNVALTTNYKFRGQDQDTLGNNGNYKTGAVKPAIQGGLDYVSESGFYVGNWNSSVNWISGNSIEMDVYGGYRFKAAGIEWDVGTLGYVYPGATAGNTWEIYGSGTYTSEVAGAFTLKYSHTVSDDYFNYAGSRGGSGLSGRNTGYLNVAYTKEIVPKVTLKAAIGYTRMSSDIRSLGYENYVDYSVGASYDFGSGLALGGYVQGATKGSAYEVTGADGKTLNPNKARLVMVLTKTL